MGKDMANGIEREKESGKLGACWPWPPPTRNRPQGRRWTVVVWPSGDTYLIKTSAQCQKAAKTAQTVPVLGQGQLKTKS